MDADRLWQAVLENDTAFDGQIVYAVKTTGIYCRPSCSSRPPKRENVEFFLQPQAAQMAGYRACKRCQPDAVAVTDPQVEIVSQACAYIHAHLDEALTLESLGAEVGMSPFHLQKLFKDITGITPRDYTEACRLHRIKAALTGGEDITRAVYDVGWQSISRLYSKSSAHLGMTPAEYQRGAPNMQILYAIVPCALGYLMVAATEKGVCAVQLDDKPQALEDFLLHEFPSAGLVHDEIVIAGWVNEILAYIEGKCPRLELPLDVQATAFQRQVWQALQEIPYGATRTYAELAEAIGRPTASRAVANAIGSNPVAMVIPCHRVIRSDGSLGGYRWGIERKKYLLDQEQHTLQQS